MGGAPGDMNSALLNLVQELLEEEEKGSNRRVNVSNGPRCAAMEHPGWSYSR